MLLVALVAGVVRSDFLVVSLAVAGAQLVATMLIAGRFHKHIRKSAGAQVVASAALGLLLLPIEIVAQVPTRLLVVDILAWVPVFAAFSLSVRAAFARAQKRTAVAHYITAAALLLPIISGIGLYLLGAHREIGVSLIGFAGCLTFALWQPRPRSLKRAGLFMTALLVLALLWVLLFEVLA